MDKYEYKLKTEQMLELMESGAYSKAAEIADVIDWKRVRNVTMLMNVSDIYEKSGYYQKSYEVLNIAYHRAEGSRKVLYRLCALALKTGNVDEAIDYYDDFMQIAPKDPNQHVLKYKILRARRAPIEQQIEALEEFKKAEYIEEWAFQLAKLYQEAGMTAECLEECDDLILWFSEGKYVYKAMELKMQYKPLTPSQQERYDHRYEKVEAETEQIPDLTQYQASMIDAAKNNIKTGEEKAIREVAEEAAPEEQVPEEETEKSIDESEPANEDKSIQKLTKKGIGSTMKLEDALQRLLKPKDKNMAEDKNESDNDDTSENDENVSGLEDEIEEIESVIDLELVNELTGKSDKEKSFDTDLEELKAEPFEEDEKVEESEAVNAKNPEPEDIDSEDKEPKNIEPKDVEPENAGAESGVPEDDEQVDGQISIEDILSGWDREEEPIEEVKMEDKQKEEAESETILPTDIQRMIDEIEGVFPEETEPVQTRTSAKEDMEDELKDFVDDLPEEVEETDDELIEDDPEEELYDERSDESEEESSEDDYGELEEGSYEEDYEEPEEDYFEDDYEELEEGSYEEDYEEPEEDYSEDDYEELEEDFDEGDYEEPEEKYDEYGDRIIAEDDLKDIEASFEEEFRPKPEHINEPDDREIPDDDDDGIDIMSATTPLSRKETAKLIATGKTAPLPLDDISNALSMSDTGFIVHGRYELETQSGVGTRAGLTEEQKKLFSYFVPVRGMSEQLVDVLEQDRNCTNRQGTSNTGNLLIIGNKGNGKTVLAVDVVKAIQKQRDIHQGKVAIITGDSLNKKRISDIFAKLHGGALIIEKAGKLNEKTVARMNKAMEQDTGEMLIVLEEQRKPLDRLLSSNRQFRRKFTARLEVPVFINDELVTFGQTYAQENGYRIDEMGILALYSRIDALQREDHAVSIAEVKDVMDSAMDHSQKASAKKLVKRVFGKNTDDSDRIILTEKDFNA
ncbi:AAA family ATPase [Clostridium sp. C105KSO13]|uniref:AAA family ATPase n=1 Tax=Clostridium sp. C105KSO13 TaxID=1776045 RepID=UPI0007407DBE|nr:AAA family ATPase [Clostridium sp. C105KSO13]CUX22255.1 hypothetical protein BN3456_00564 [Clostridium sp. C105KSO13]